jgi:hypothetical protein
VQQGGGVCSDGVGWMSATARRTGRT